MKLTDKLAKFYREYEHNPRKFNAATRAAIHAFVKNGRGVNSRKLTPEQRRADLAEYVKEQADYFKTKSARYAARLATR